MEENARNAQSEELTFLRFAVKHLESRIAFLDQKAGLLWAALSLVVGADFTFIKLLSNSWDTCSPTYKLSFIVLSGSAIGLLFLASWFLLHVVRPSPLWGTGVGRSCFSGKPPAKYHLWFNPSDRSRPERLSNEALSEDEIRAQLVYAVNGLRCLAYHKQANYRIAAQLAKVLVLVLAIGSLMVVGFSFHACNGT